MGLDVVVLIGLFALDCWIVGFGVLDRREGKLLLVCWSFRALLAIGLLDTWVCSLETASDSWKLDTFVWDLVWNSPRYR